jgi:hypothetical protein
MFHIDLLRDSFHLTFHWLTNLRLPICQPVASDGRALPSLYHHLPSGSSNVAKCYLRLPRVFARVCQGFATPFPAPLSSPRPRFFANRLARVCQWSAKRSRTTGSLDHWDLLRDSSCLPLSTGPRIFANQLARDCHQFACDGHAKRHTIAKRFIIPLPRVLRCLLPLALATCFGQSLPWPTIGFANALTWNA